jgi:hypothetical protein
MKKIIILSIMVVLMMASFFMSWLFFLGSGIIDERTWEMDEWKTVQIARDLDSIPLVRIASEDIRFHISGTIKFVDDTSLTVTDRRGDHVFEYTDESLKLKVGDKVRVFYHYSEDGEKEVIHARLSQVDDQCERYTIKDCPNECVVCPPCEECSSLSCQSEEYCLSIGFDEKWYESVDPDIGQTVESIEVGEEEIHCLGWMDSELGMVLRESNQIDSAKYSFIINKTTCEKNDLFGSTVSIGKASGTCGMVENIWDSYMQDCGTFEFYLTIDGAVRDTCLLLNDEVVVSEKIDGKNGEVLGKGSCS